MLIYSSVCIYAHQGIKLKFEMYLLPKMQQTCKNRYTPNGYASLRVTTIACGLEVPKRHGKTRRFLIHLHPYSSIRKYLK